MANVYGSTVPGAVNGTTTGPRGVLTNFTLSSAAQVTHFRMYSVASMSTDDITVIIYAAGVNNQTQLTNFTFTPNTSVGWHSYALPSPISLAAAAGYTLLFGLETGTIKYGYNLGALPDSAGSLSYTLTYVRTGASNVWSENNAIPLTDTDGYAVDLEIEEVTVLDINAGADQAIYNTQDAELLATHSGGTGSRTVAWTQDSGPAGDFSSPSTAATDFTPTGGNGTYVLRATVTDGASATDFDTVTITVTDAPITVRFTLINDSTGWTPTGGTVREVLEDDDLDTLLTSSNNPVALLVDGSLAPCAAPDADQGATIYLSTRKVSATTGTVTARLYEGATLISTSAATALPDTLTTDNVQIVFPAEDVAEVSSPDSWSDVAGGTGADEYSIMRVTLAFTAA